MTQEIEQAAQKYGRRREKAITESFDEDDVLGGYDAADIVAREAEWAFLAGAEYALGKREGENSSNLSNTGIDVDSLGHNVDSLGHNVDSSARLKIAVMAMQGILANPNIVSPHTYYEKEAEDIAIASLDFADTLITQSNKTDNQ